jgi:hypothetical protein
MLSIARRLPTFQAAAVNHARSSHDVASVISRVSLRVVGCLVVLVGLMAGGASAATGNSIRKIVVFQAGTSVQVQRQVVARSGSRVLNLLPLIDGVAIELLPENAVQALVALQADPTVAGVYDDLTNSGQDGGGDNVIVITPADPPTQEFVSVHLRDQAMRQCACTVRVEQAWEAGKGHLPRGARPRMRLSDSRGRDGVAV